MPRPQRCRRICCEPEFEKFSPSEAADTGSVVLTLDEFEVIRLVDLEKQTHEQCAQRMDISRTTVTEICESARQKIADCLVNGKKLIISGGNYRLCEGGAVKGCGKNCTRTGKPDIGLAKGSNIMRIAVTYENGQVFQHFGHTERFEIYDVEDGRVVLKTLVNTNGSGHGALADILRKLGTDVLICGGIGGGAKRALDEAGIRLYGGVTGECGAAVEALLAGRLVYNPDVKCSHHEHEHGDGHACGDHGCGDHGCR